MGVENRQMGGKADKLYAKYQKKNYLLLLS